MFKFKKMIASVLTSIMTFSMAATVSLAAVPQDVANTKYEEAAEVLGVLNVMVGDVEGTFRPNDTIIRSEVAKVGVAISGLTEVANITGGVTKYPDVAKDYWANGFINVATDQKLVVGDTEGTFRPESEITFAEAVTILVRALGYEPRAIAKGGYPTGYLVTASDIGLTKGVTGTGNKEISRGDVAQLAFNALTIKMMEQTGFGGDVNYEIVDKTLLKDKLGVEKVTGQVMAVGNASLDGSSLSKNQIKIGEKIYETGIADVRQVLGFTADAYINEDGETLTVRPTSDNKSVTIPAENIAEITNTESTKEIKFWADAENDKKTTKETIKTDAKVIYNGKAGSFEDFKKIGSGSITLLDADTNGTNDVVFVNETVNYVVEEVVTTSHKIVDKYGQKTLVADPEDENLTFVMVQGTEKKEIKDLKEWDVLTATISKDGELVFIEISNEKAEGKVEKVSGGDTFYIGGKGYKVAKNYPHGVKLGDEGIFYLDAEGKIAAVDSETAIAGNYAYLMNAALSSGMDKVLEMKLFTKEGKTEVLSSADKITVNGEKDLTPAEALAKIKGEGSSVKSQLITFEANSKGEVNEINIATESSTINENKFMLNMKEDGVVYKAASGKLVGKTMSVNVSEDTLVFDIPAGKTDASDFAVSNGKFFTDNDTYNVLVFDVNEERYAKAIIVTNAEGVANEDSALAVVDSIAKGQNDDGDEIEILTAYRNGEKIELLTTESGILVKGEKALEQGDVIQIKTNGKGEIEKVTVLFDITTRDTEAETKVSDKTTTYYGKVTKKFTTSFNMQVNDGAVHNFSFANADIYTVDTTKTRNQIKVGDAGDIQKFDDLNPEKVFVRVYENVVKEIIIVK